MNLRLGCFLAVVVFFGIPAVASRFLPWWGTLLVVVAEFALLGKLGPWLIKRQVQGFAKRMFLTKSDVLKGAQVHVWRVEPVYSADPPAPVAGLIEQDGSPVGETPADPSPTDDDADEADRVEGRLVLIEATVTPLPGQGQMQHWDPAEITLVPFDADVSYEATEKTDGSPPDEAHLKRLSLIDDHGQEVVDLDKLAGPARLRMIFDVPTLLTGRAKLRYYFNALGDVRLP
jgi:hypothetical protein